MKFESKRYYQFQDYNPSFNRLLLRSTSDEEYDYSIDVVFIGVESMKLQHSYSGLKIYYSHSTDDLDVYKINDFDSIHCLQCIVIESDIQIWDSMIDGLDTNDKKKKCEHWNVLWNTADFIRDISPRFSRDL